MTKKKAAKKPAKKSIKVREKTTPKTPRIQAKASETAVDAMAEKKPLAWKITVYEQNDDQENRAQSKEPSAFWKPVLAAPRWDWLAAVIVVVLLCLLAMCRPVNGGEVRVDVGQRSGGVAVGWDSGRVDVGWGLGWWRPRPAVDPWRPWWQRPPQWHPGPKHRPGDLRRGPERERNDRGPRR